jgi:hypothetical protein
MDRCTVTAVGGLGLALALTACSDDLVRPNPTTNHPADPARFDVTPFSVPAVMGVRDGKWDSPRS